MLKEQTSEKDEYNYYTVFFSTGQSFCIRMPKHTNPDTVLLFGPGTVWKVEVFNYQGDYDNMFVKTGTVIALIQTTKHKLEQQENAVVRLVQTVGMLKEDEDEPTSRH